MKRLFLLTLALALTGTLAAQRHGNRHTTTPRVVPTPSIIVQAQQAESFYVYLNGNLVNDVPLTQVVIDRLDNNLQQIIVVLNHPARKAVALEVYADLNGTPVTVSYSRRNDQLTLTAPETSLPRPSGHQHAGHQHGHKPNTEVVIVNPPAPPVPPTVVVEEPLTVSDEWVTEMVGVLNNQSFDSEKSTTARGLLNNGLPFTASQIARIAATFDFSTGQVDFLKAAYTHCIDPENYERAIGVLTFSNDRQTVRTYIESLR